MAVPKLRFKGFKEDWKTVKFESLFAEVNEKTGDTKNFPLYSLTVQDGVTKKTDRYNREFLVKKENNFKIVRSSYFVSNPMNMTIGALAQYKGFEDISVSGYYNVFKNISNYKNQFLEDYLKSSKMIWLYKSIATGSLIEKQRVHFSQFIKLAVSLPNYQEANKISDFMEILTKKIQLQQEKIDLLKEQKKGFMQKIFSQELRFKDEDGQEFPEWELTSIKEIATSISYGMNAAAKPFDNKNIYIRITDIDDESRKFLEHNKVSPDGTLDDKFLLDNGDILFARTGASVGKSYYYEYDNRPFYFAGFLIRVRLSKNINSHFIYQQTLTTMYSKWVQVMSMRSGQPGINAEEYGQFEILLPCKKEQDKISSFLYSLDKKIESMNKYKYELEIQKQAFMQQMFI